MPEWGGIRASFCGSSFWLARFAYDAEQRSMASSVAPTTKTKPMASETASDTLPAMRSEPDDPVGDRTTYCWMERTGVPGQEVAEQALPEQHVQQPEQHRPAGEQAQRDEQRGVGGASPRWRRRRARGRATEPAMRPDDGERGCRS